MENKKTYWPHMILGFLAVGITLSYWTIKSAMSLPVQESNQYMQKYQMADININEILRQKQAFDAKYSIVLEDVETMVATDNIHSNVPQPNPVKLSHGNNTFSFSVKSMDGSSVTDANVTFLLTQPYSVKEDKLITDVKVKDGRYIISNLSINKPGRYTLQLRVKIKDSKMTGYSAISAYLKH